VFGPLPRLHLITLATASVAVFLGVGLWVGHLTVVPFTLPVGAALGAVAGIAVAWLLVHDSHQRSAQPARAVRRH
jgi:hypothetical protein